MMSESSSSIWSLLGLVALVHLPNTPPSEWNQHTYCLDKLCRSSNQIEGWHNGFNRIVECSHPSFHIFCEAILTEQGLTAGKIS